MSHTFPPGFIDKAIAEGKSVFAIRYPQAASWEWGVSDSVSAGIVPGSFVVAPFDMESVGPVSIPFGGNSGQPGDMASFGRFPNESTPREDHRRAVETISAYHRRHGGKTVLSRVELIPLSGIPAESILRSLDRLYPDATVFGFSTPQSGLWVGATPELLLAASGGQLRTMALAGTRRRGESGEWDGKNIEEQRLVVDFIMDAMADCLPREGELFTCQAGPVEHLCTAITADASPLEKGELQPDELLRRLSPTPALCGSDRAASMRLIASCEAHDRGAYGGFFGLYRSPGDFDFRVNLRSMRMEGATGALYAGGGITSLSRPDDEWTETCRKSASMRKALSDNAAFIENR